MIDEAFTWGDDRPPQTPWNKTIIYETHVKGFTKLHPEVPEKLRGTYAGLGSEAAIRYLTNLGITAVELLPVHEHVDDRHLVDRGLVNYWGYNTLGFFAPEPQYASTDSAPRRGPRVQDDGPQSARRRHRGDPRRGLQPHGRRQPAGADALASAASTTPPTTALSEDDPRYYMDFTGCGNTFNMQQSRACCS